MKYVVLVRGINVGGHNKVPKAEFQKVLETAGLSNVLIYLNSGNAVGESATEPDARKIQEALETHFGFAIPTLVLSAEKVQAIAAAIPESWTNDAPRPDKSGQKSDVLYLFEEVNTPEIIEQFGYRPEIETLIYVDGAVLANVSRKNQTRYSLLKLMGTPLYKKMTIRNVTTARKLAELVKQ